jgi:hypothetical protein
MKKGKYMDALLSLPLNYSLFIDMEKNKPINVALDDIRYKPEIINNLEYRFINDDLGMVISFTSNPQLSSSASFLRLNVLSSLN